MKAAIEIFTEIRDIKKTVRMGEILKFYDGQHWFVSGALMIRHKGIKWPADIPLKDCPESFPFDMGNVEIAWNHYYKDIDEEGVDFDLGEVMWKNKNAMLGDVQIAGWIMRAIFALPRPKLAPFTCKVAPVGVYIQAGDLWEAVLAPIRS